MPQTTIQQLMTENRSSQVRIEKRAEGEGKTLVGYAAVFYREGEPETEYRMYDDFVERIKPGAFDRAIRERDDTRALFNHRSENLLGRLSANTLRLSTDSVGLRYEIDLPETQAGRDVAVSVERGDLSGSSFAFLPESVVYREEGDVLYREIESVQLRDVGPVTYPAYEGTTTGLRSGEEQPEIPELAEFRNRNDSESDAVNMRADLVKNDLA